MGILTIRFPDSTATRVGTAVLTWIEGKPIKLYLKDPILKPEGLIGRSHRCYIYRVSGEKVRLWYIPSPDEILTFVLSPRAMS